MARKYTNEQRRRVKQLYEEGKKYEEISSLTGIPRGSISGLLHGTYHKKATRFSKYSNEQREAVKEAYKAGYTYDEITELTGVKHGMISLIMKGETDRNNMHGGRVAHTIPKHPPIQQPQTTFPDMTKEQIKAHNEEQLAKQTQMNFLPPDDKVALYSPDSKFFIKIERTRVIINDTMAIDRKDFSTLVTLLIKADKIAEVL